MKHNSPKRDELEILNKESKMFDIFCIAALIIYFFIVLPLMYFFGKV